MLKKIIIVCAVFLVVSFIFLVIVPGFVGGNKKKVTKEFSFFVNVVDFYKTRINKAKGLSYYRVVKNENVPNTMNVNAIHMLRSVTDTIGNSFIITTKDGKVIVMDGGHRTETPYFLEYLKAVTGQEKPHIDGWFLSHPHDDHCEVFLEVMEYHFCDVEVDKIYLNFPPIDFYAQTDKWADGILHEYESLRPLFRDKEQILHDGDLFSIGKADFTVFYTFDPAFSDCNDSSLVFRMDLGGESVLFTGDCGEKAGEKVVDNWAESGLIHCDVCQMSHHGQNGCNKRFYETVAPSVCLWPTPSWVWDNRNGNLKTEEVRAWIEELGVQYNFVAKDGSKVLYLSDFSR